MSDVTLILLAGGTGSRMQMPTPKQFLQFKSKPIIFYSLDIFKQVKEITEIIVVAEAAYRPLLSPYHVKWADPGKRRQDSLWNGLAQVSPLNKWVMIHDAARPFITCEMVYKLIDEGKQVGAATVAVPLKATIKEATLENIVSKTLNRSTLWEIQTPQFVSKQVLLDGFKVAFEDDLTVTDDTSLAELIHHPVKLVVGTYKNIKITTPEDLSIAQALDA